MNGTHMTVRELEKFLAELREDGKGDWALCSIDGQITYTHVAFRDPASATPQFDEQQNPTGRGGMRTFDVS